MKWIDNPFDKDTQVTIFSNGSMADDWALRNCNECNKKNCDLLDAIIGGEGLYCDVPLHIAKRIGITYNPLYQQGEVYSRCKEFDDGNSPF